MTTTLEISDAHVVKLLLAEEAGRYLDAYMGRVRSVSEAAVQVERSMQRTHYWTQRFQDAGLVEVAEVIRRKGRPIRRYRCVADEFVIPAKALPPGTFEAQMQEINRGLTSAFARSYPDLVYGGDLHIRRTSPTDVGITYDRAASEGDLPEDAVQSSFTMRLTRHEARQLRDELIELRDRWIAIGAGRDADRTAYLSVVAVAPVPPD